MGGRIRGRAGSGASVRLPYVPATPHARRSVGRAVALSLVGLSVLLSACGKEPAAAVPALTEEQVKAELSQPAPGATKPQVALERRADELIPGGKDPAATLQAQVDRLRGTPVVVNMWADWCKPCKTEMPIFQRVALAQRGSVAFFGIAAETTQGKAEAYLRDRIAMPYPSIFDEFGKVNKGTGADSLPKTLFYDRAGKRFVHLGPYTTEADLLTDIERYAS